MVFGQSEDKKSKIWDEIKKLDALEEELAVGGVGSGSYAEERKRLQVEMGRHPL